MKENYNQHLDEISKLIILRMASLRKIESSYQFERMFLHIGSIASPTRLLDELAQDKLILHEGIFDKDPSFYKNILTTKKGLDYLNEKLKNTSFSTKELTGQRMDILKKIFGKD